MSVLVDTSVWIDHFRGRITPQTIRLRSLHQAMRGRVADPDGDVIIADLVLCEVLRGVVQQEQYVEVRYRMLGHEIVSIAGTDVALAAADHYRYLRRLGVTLRGTIDLLIGTFCILEGHALLHADRDFAPMAEYLGLRVL